MKIKLTREDAKLLRDLLLFDDTIPTALKQDGYSYYWDDDAIGRIRTALNDKLFRRR